MASSFVTPAAMLFERLFMKRTSLFVITAAACVIAALPFTAGRADDDASPIFGVKVPAGYRQWEMVAPSHEQNFDEFRAILGNPLSMTAYREGTLPFPDGAMLAKLAWKHVPLAGFQGAFVPGPATTVQIMVKDSKNTRRPAAGASAASSTASPWTKPSTKPASPATRPASKTTTSSSPASRHSLEAHRLRRA
jgi:hypothetical protein